MFRWSDGYGWRFGGNCVDAVGPNEADTGLFEGHPYKGLAKEILQNSLDAKDPNLPDSQPVEVEFTCLKVPLEEIPGYHRLDEVIGLCAAFYNTGDDGQKLKRWVRQSKKYVSQGFLHVLKISDFYTTGLSGVTKLKGTNWSGLVREKGATNKSEGKGGSHGVGKFAPYSFSSLRTVLYSTKNAEGETAFQGKTILTSFQENEQVFHNVGVFGSISDPTSPPIFDMDLVPTAFQRDRVGTDVIVVGFERDDDWKEQIVISVLQYCFYAIYQGRLVVRVSDEDTTIEINQDVLESKMTEYKGWFDQNGHTDNFQFTAPKYLDVLSHPKMKHFAVPFENKGEIELYLVVDPDLDGRSIYEMRSAGMGIQEDTGWRGIGTHFNGLFIATGKGAADRKPENNIDSFLRKCEDPAHNEWASAFYKDHEKEAKFILYEIHRWIRERILDQIHKYDGTSHDAFELSKFIKNIHNVGDNTEEEDAFQNYEPQSLEPNIIRFRAYYKADEVKKASSIVTVQVDNEVERIQLNLNSANIIVNLPQTQYDAYMRIGTSTSDQVSLLTGLVSVPVIALALNEIDTDDESDYAELPWYKSLRAMLDKLADGDPSKVNSLLEDKLSTAQLMLGDNLITSFTILDKREW